MSAAYVIVKLGYEYNDETYEIVGDRDSDGTPVSVFIDQNKAVTVLRKKTVEEYDELVSSDSLYCYTYNTFDQIGRRAWSYLDSLAEDKNLKNEDGELILPSSDSDNYELPAFYKIWSQMTVAEKEQFVSLSGLQFFRIVKTTLE